MVRRTFLHYLGVLSGLEKPRTQTTGAERGSLLKHLPGKTARRFDAVATAGSLSILVKRSGQESYTRGPG